MSIGGIALAADFAMVVVTATALSYVARKTHQPTIVAYIFTGILLGPVVLGVVTEDQLIDLMAELGLGFLLFLLGIEMSFENIRDILRSVVNISIGQTILQTAAALGVAFLLGFRGMDVIVIALATVFGATPVIVKLLSDKDELKTLPGRIDVGVLVVQDIYLVIVLAMVGAGLTGTVTEVSLTIGRILALMAGVGVVAYLGYRYLLPTLLGLVAGDQDVLFVTGLAWAFVFIFGAESLDLSVEVGAFLAGLSLAQLPYSTELQERMQPVTDFFLVVFFSSIGLQLAADELTAYWVEAVIASAALMAANFLIMFYLIDREGFTAETSFIGSVNMIQVSEFSLVVGSLAVSQELIGQDILGYLSLMALLTMTLSTYVILNNYRLYERVRPYLDRFEDDDAEDASLAVHENHAVVVGYDAIVEESIPLLEEHFEGVVVIDRSAENVEELQAADFEYIYGDFKHGEIRQESDVENAAFVLSSARLPSINKQVIDDAPDDAVVFVTAETREHAGELYDHGADYVIMRDDLAGDCLGEYVATYFEDEGSFTRRIDSSIRRIRREGGEIGG